MVNTIDIGSTALYPGNELSNFALHQFVYDRVPCNSMEGLLQSLHRWGQRLPCSLETRFPMVDVEARLVDAQG